MTTIARAMAAARSTLTGAGVETPELDARLLAEAAFGLDAAGLMMQGGREAPALGQATLDAFVGRRASGEPVHRILGLRAFYAHDFHLSLETLEPRPDTEILVELAAEAMNRHVARSGRCLFADIGTGTGAIAVSLLALHPTAVGLAVDLSEGALRTARRNAQGAGVGERFHPLACDYGAALGARLDMIVSNPPYIPSAEIDTLSREVRIFDPRLALDGGEDGLVAYRRLAEDAARLLGRHGDVLVEIGAGQEGDVEDIFRDRGLRLSRSRRDLGGIVRALWFRPVT